VDRIKITEIQVGERFRKKFEDMDSLCTSVEKFGLIEPIILDENNVLIAGERRLKAHVMLKKTTIEFKRMEELTELEKKEVELEENIQRKAFTWQEEVNAKAELHSLKRSIHGKAVKGYKTEGWGVRDTANALGESTGTVSMDIELSKGLELFPELLKEKSKTQAFKKMKSLKKDILGRELARRLQEKGLMDNPDVTHGNCLEEMAKMEDESIDFILTDPPYGIDVGSAHTFDRMTKSHVSYEDSDFATMDLLDKAFAQFYRILKKDTHLIIFCGVDKFPTLYLLLKKHGFNPHHLPLIWDKGSGSYPSQGVTFVHSYEAIIHAVKGSAKLNGNSRDVFPIKRVPSNKKIHESEKPTELLRDFINLLSNPGDIVFDPFAGSFATLVAAKETNRRGRGVELDKVNYTNGCKRLGGTNESTGGGKS